MAIVSIQSHVAYGYVGNKAAAFPLQSMGYDVCPIHTVQFSNHTGYGKWTGDVFSGEHITSLAKGLEDVGVPARCQAILSGYMGSRDIAQAVQGIVQSWKAMNPEILYLCDPVIGNTNCFVKPEVLDFFKTQLMADIITPNQFEAETLSGRKIETQKDLIEVAGYFHDLGVKIVVITGVNLGEGKEELAVFVSSPEGRGMIITPEHTPAVPVNGTGDLFSALFLGCYLAHKDSFLALRQTVFFMQEVMLSTIKAQTRELQVLSRHYALASCGALPELVRL